MEDGIDLTADLDLPVGDLHDPSQRAMVERELTHIEGVTSARIVPGYGRPIDELHVVATSQRDIKPLVRDLQSLLIARFGVPIDHRVISVVQLDERDIASGDERVIMSQVTVTHEGLAVSADVSIDDGTNQLRGHAEGPASAAGRRRTTARAALDALRPLLGESRAIEIEGVEVTRVLGHELALCIVHIHSRTGEQTAVGSAIISRDESEAIARAVLDALNRTLSTGDRP